MNHMIGVIIQKIILKEQYWYENLAKPDTKINRQNKVDGDIFILQKIWKKR